MTRRDALRAGWPLLLAGCPAAAGRVQAGGSTSLDPLVQVWAAEYRRQTGVEIDYARRGSGFGVAQTAAGTLAFGVTDDPPTPAERGRAEASGRRLVLLPLAVEAVAVVYHLPGPLTLSAPVLAALLDGRIARWDDPAVAALNPGRSLPADAVRPVVRAEGSGTTATLTGYLCQSDPAFVISVGRGRKPRWPAGVIGQEGSDGVAGLVERTPGTVGYVEARYARRAGLSCAALVNRAGAAITPQPAGVAAADGQTDAADPAAYPVVGLGYAVLPDRPRPDAVRFLRWAVTAGRPLATATGYAPLPDRLAAEATAALG